MPLLRNVEVYFVRLDPKKPVKSLTKGNKQWSLQVRTSNKDIKKEWEDLGIKVKTPMIEDEKTGVPAFAGYWTANFSRKSKKSDPNQKDPSLWEDNEPVEVIDGKRRPVDPTTIGNGSIANIRVYRREYKIEGVDRVGFTLMALQLVSLKLYTQQPFEDDFDDEEYDTEIIAPAESTEDDGNDDTAPVAATRKSATTKAVRKDTDF